MWRAPHFQRWFLRCVLYPSLPPIQLQKVVLATQNRKVAPCPCPPPWRVRRASTIFSSECGVDFFTIVEMQTDARFMSFFSLATRARTSKLYTALGSMNYYGSSECHNNCSVETTLYSKNARYGDISNFTPRKSYAKSKTKMGVVRPRLH